MPRNRCSEVSDIDAHRFLSPRIERHASLVSTNDEAMRRAREGHGGGVWIVADEQTGGRGRHGRPWTSPPGNLHASLLLIDPVPVAQTPELGFVAGLALACALRETLDGDARVKIKWPNDMLFEGAKLSGLMLEGSTLADGRFAVIIGIGVNCTHHPAGLSYPATSLAKIAGRPVGTAEVLARLVNQMSHWLGLYGMGRNFALIRQQWLGMAAGIGEPIIVDIGTRKVAGSFTSIDGRGRLIVETPDGPSLIEAGDVFLPGASPAVPSTENPEL